MAASPAFIEEEMHRLSVTSGRCDPGREHPLGDQLSLLLPADRRLLGYEREEPFSQLVDG